MAKRFNGEGSIRQRSNGSWEARYTNPITINNKVPMVKRSKKCRKN